MTAEKKAVLVLEDGSEFPGRSFGADESARGEVVFSTGLTGYPQSLSDPSYKGQILVSTYPTQGNYGIPLRSAKSAAKGKKAKTLTMETDEQGIPLWFESQALQTAGLVVADYAEVPSHWNSGVSLGEWLKEAGVPGITGIDTRALTKRLREHGTMKGKIIIGKDTKDEILRFGEEEAFSPVPEVSPKEVHIYQGTAEENSSDGTPKKCPTIVLLDCGAKANILRCLLSHNVQVICVPWDFDISSIDYDGLFLSNGPGDPKSCGKTRAGLRKALSKGKPIFGVCLGVQLLALAAGGDTYKLPYGHRSQNQPCLELPPHSHSDLAAAREAGLRCYITSQNHGYAVRADSLPRGWEPWFINANDGTIEGIRHSKKPFSAVQFHPEGCPGPRDTEFLIDNFIKEVISYGEGKQKN
jgi:carbamoyl-phosphate synthase small subunit